MDKKTTFFNILKDLPKFTQPYTSMLYDTKKISTAVVQATELRAFLSFIALENEILDVKKLDISVLDKIDQNLLDLYFKNVSQNTQVVKISCLNQFFLFMMKQRKLSYNPLWDYEAPAFVGTEKEQISYSDVKNTLLGIASGQNLSEKEASFASRTQLRDIAIISLLYSGLSLSQCAALNLEDVTLGEDTDVVLIDALNLLEENGIKNVIGLLYGWLSASSPSNSPLYKLFHQESSLLIENTTFTINEFATAALLGYMTEQNLIQNGPLFFSLRRRRISERTIEHLVSKHFERYANIHVSTSILSSSAK